MGHVVCGVVACQGIINKHLLNSFIMEQHDA